MTDTQDLTSPEHVEEWADGLHAQGYVEGAATLRALSAALEAERAKTAAMLRACKAGDAPDQGEWDAAIEAAAKVAGDYTALFCDAAALRVSKLIRTLKKGQTND